MDEKKNGGRDFFVKKREIKEEGKVKMLRKDDTYRYVEEAERERLDRHNPTR